MTAQTLLSQVEGLGIDCSLPRAVILVSLPENSPQLKATKEVAIAGIKRFFKLPNEAICLDAGSGYIAILKAANSKNLEEWMTLSASNHPASWADLDALRKASNELIKILISDTREEIKIGIGRYHPGRDGLLRSYQDAKTALVLGQHIERKELVFCLTDLGLPALVCPDEQTKLEVAHHLLNPLDYEPELLRTLELYLTNNCHLALTATMMSLHRNTLGHRLDKIESLIGLNPRRFEDAVQIRLALMVKKLCSRPMQLGNQTTNISESQLQQLIFA
jgi:carbohydrate diacid regulator